VQVGNALGFKPERRFDFVRTGLEYVPNRRRRALVAWLLDEVVAEGGRLIVGKYNERIGLRAVERDLGRWGFRVTGRAEREHRKEPRLAYRACWMDAHRATDGDLRLRALRESDLPQLSSWLAKPHVARWWNLPSGLDKVRAKFLPRIAGDEATYMLLAEKRGRPIGWLQWYRWRDYPEHAARIGASATEAGIDLAIGEPERLGHGLGPRLIRLLLERTVFIDPAITGCVSDPHRDNIRSLRAFEKAGFAIAGAA
jgi:aminoglycoside 6'-N-acetyltransferase